MRDRTQEYIVAHKTIRPDLDRQCDRYRCGGDAAGESAELCASSRLRHAIAVRRELLVLLLDSEEIC